MRRLACVPLALIALHLAAARARAQANVCDLVSQAGTYTVVGAEGSRVVNAQGPLLVRCRNGEELRADSAVLYQAQNEVYLYRQVDYQDPGKSLTSDNAIYNSATGRLYATGNVVFTDKNQGSTLRGPELEYFRAMQGRPQSQATARQRPHVTVRPKSSGGTTSRRTPMEIDADLVTSVGDRYMTATGNVVINDNDTRSTAEEAYYDQVADHVELRRQAHVNNDKYQLSGDFIASDLKNGSISKVLAQNNARLVSERLTVTGPQLQLFFERDLLQRMVSGRVPGSPLTAPPAAPAAPPPSTPRDSGAAASGSAANRPATSGAAAKNDSAAASAPALPPEQRSIALAKGFRLEADSIEAITPEQVVRQVNAVGRARGESWDTLGAVRVLQDTGAAAVKPDTATRVLTQAPDALDQKDVLTADTIIAYFRRDSAGGDTTRAPRLAGRPAAAPGDTSRAARGDTAKTEIERLLAIGDAHSIYRTRPDSTKPANEQRPGINYLVGDRIDLRFKAGEVDVARVRGLKQGLYLDPQTDSTATDSTGAARNAGGRTAGAARPGAASPAGNRPAGTSPPPAAGTPAGTAPVSRPPPTPPVRTAPISLAPAIRTKLNALAHSRTRAPVSVPPRATPNALAHSRTSAPVAAGGAA
ncbi:MAG TPA: OstA-like protein [Longimicrobium sp.]|nr:OstA-like protein [Longimicrobium sp.]